jgi:hypothetical protein
MKTEQQQLNDIYARVRQVFPEDQINLVPQQVTLLNNAIHRVVQKDGDEAVTMDRLEGFKELITQHLWFDALSTATPDSRFES